MAKKKENIEEPLEKQLWKAADKLRKNIDAAEYKHVVLGLIFLKYISVSFEELYARLQKEIELGADPEDREEYKAENVFYVPQVARWSNLVSNAKDPKIGKFIDDAMDAIEKENPILKGQPLHHHCFLCNFPGIPYVHIPLHTFYTASLLPYSFALSCKAKPPPSAIRIVRVSEAVTLCFSIA